MACRKPNWELKQSCVSHFSKVKLPPLLIPDMWLRRVEFQLTRDHEGRYYPIGRQNTIELLLSSKIVVFIELEKNCTVRRLIKS